MVNGWYVRNPPWKQLNRKLNNEGQLLDGWEKLEARCREIVGWRMQLIPYLRSAFEGYRENGTPPFRALVLDAPKDDRLRYVDDQFMIGDRMMVAPLFAGEMSRKIVLPAGRWHDFWTGERVEGGTELVVQATMEQIPVYVKSGSLVPWAYAGLHVQDPVSHELMVRVYGDGSIAWTLNERKETLRLSWNCESGRAEGTSHYKIREWKHIG